VLPEQRQQQQSQQQQQRRHPAGEAAELQLPAEKPQQQPPETALMALASTARAALHKAPRLSAGAFESAWQQTAQVDVWGATLRGPPLPSDAELIALFKQGHVHCLASGEVGGVRKLYLYSQRQAGAALSLVEISLAVESRRATCVFKDQDHSSREEAVSVTFVKACVRSLAD
jgi:hypothetical protein